MAKTFKAWEEYYNNCDKNTLLEEITRDGEHIELLEQRIKKAIEWVDNSCLYSVEKKQLYEILRGE